MSEAGWWTRAKVGDKVVPNGKIHSIEFAPDEVLTIVKIPERQKDFTWNGCDTWFYFDQDSIGYSATGFNPFTDDCSHNA